jgi:serine-type D-Ala-D-Ala carboxypeptidase/endopeptidase (penicillin-binding protein 4)
LPWVSRAGAGASASNHVRRAGIASLPLLLVLTLAVVALLLPTAAGAASAPDAATRIDTILHNRHLMNDATSVFVWDLQTGSTLYSRNVATPLAPASNLKLVTSAAVLQAWGPRYRLVTQVLADVAPTASGTLYGDLYLRGMGDPSLSTLSYQRQVLDLKTASIEGLARRLKASGLRRVRGGVVGDESYFDQLRTVAAWRPGLEDESGRLSALSADEGLRNGNRIKSPALQAAKLLTRALRQIHVKVEHAPRVSVAPDGAQLLAQQRSAPVAQLLRHMDKESDNFFAEVFTKGLGAALYGEGTTDAGLQAGREVLAQTGAEPDSFRLADGSGLSYDDRLTTADLVRLLIAMYRRDDFPVFFDALAVAGKDGTLADRMRGTAAAGNAHAKTGSLDIAAALSGYVTSADGHLLVFSLLSNASRLDYWHTIKAYDAIIAVLAASQPGGDARLRDTPAARQHVMSAAEADFVSGRALVPSVEVPSP